MKRAKINQSLVTGAGGHIAAGAQGNMEEHVFKSCLAKLKEVIVSSSFFVTQMLFQNISV